MEQTKPMQGPLEICCFALELSVGDISEDIPGPLRQAALHAYFDAVWQGEDEKPWSVCVMEQATASLEKVRAQAKAGKPLRIWYSERPDELCGLYWLLAQLDPVEHCGPVSAVCLPRYEEREGGSIVAHTGWHEIQPGDWSRYLPLEKPLSPAFQCACAIQWHELQQENAALRVVLNGRLVSAPEDMYDSFIRREIAKEKNEFHEAVVFGNVIGRYQLGVSDGWIIHRIETMVQNGELDTVTQPGPYDPVYHRVLRKK